jgi:hypothetical protein
VESEHLATNDIPKQGALYAARAWLRLCTKGILKKMHKSAQSPFANSGFFAKFDTFRHG